MHYYYIHVINFPSLSLSPFAGVSLSQRELQKREASRLLCDHHFRDRESLNCNFHDTCIESLYRTGAEGFSQSYALPRCKAIRAMTYSNTSSCSNCLRTKGLDDWLLQTELCLQPKMYALAKNWTNHKHDEQDPHERLAFERRSFKELNKCYNEIQLRSIISSSTDREALKSDLIKILNALTVKPYYRPVVHEDFSTLISNCDHSLAQEVVPSPPNRILFCMVESRSSVNYQTKIDVMSSTLQSDPSKFSLASDDDKFNERCGQLSSAQANGENVSQRKTFLIIQWLVDGDVTIDNHYAPSLSNSNIKIVFYRYQDQLGSEDIQDEKPYCGNGKWEAGEDCDMFADNKLGLGCNDNCQVMTDYECLAKQSSRSNCFETVCGDGRRNSDEECDDGNTISGDGCSTSCRVETGFHCSQSYNVTSQCEPVPSPSPSPSTTSSSVFSSPALSSSSLTSLTVTSATSTPTPSSNVEAVTSSSRRVSPRGLISLLIPLLLTFGLLALVASNLRL